MTNEWCPDCETYRPCACDAAEARWEQRLDAEHDAEALHDLEVWQRAEPEEVGEAE